MTCNVKRFEKDPDTTTFFTLDWASDLRAGETLQSAQWTVAAGMTKLSESISGTIATVWVTGGTLGNTYVATCRASYDSGRTEDYSVQIYCKAS